MTDIFRVTWPASVNGRLDETAVRVVECGDQATADQLVELIRPRYHAAVVYRVALPDERAQLVAVRWFADTLADCRGVRGRSGRHLLDLLKPTSKEADDVAV